MAKSYPESWGGHYTNKDYEPFMSGDTIIDKPISLAGNHALTSVNSNLADPVTRRFVKKIGGRLVDREEVIRPAQQLSLTMTILFGNAFETPALARARLGSSCRTTVYVVNLCPADPRYAHAYIFPEGILNPPTHVNDLVSINDTATADWQAEFRVEEEIVLRAIGAFRTKPADDPLYAIAYLDENCASCTGTVVHSDCVAVGGAGGGSDEVLILVSSSRMGSSTVVASPPSPVANVGTSVYTDGDVVLVGFSDLPKSSYGAMTDPATGGTLFSNDGMQSTPALDTNITVSIMGVNKFNGQYIAVGGAGLGAAYVAVSDDGVTWTAVTSDVLPDDEAITAIDVDNDAGKIYVTTEGGSLFSGRENGGAIVFLDLTSRLPSSPSALFSVHVYAQDHFAVGGAAGFYAESLDGGDTFTSPAIPGTDAVNSITGSTHRALVGSGTKVYVRDVMTYMEFTLVTVQDALSITGDIVGLAQTREKNVNHFLAVSDEGEAESIRHFSPYNV